MFRVNRVTLKSNNKNKVKITKVNSTNSQFSAQVHARTKSDVCSSKAKQKQRDYQKSDPGRTIYVGCLGQTCISCFTIRVTPQQPPAHNGEKFSAQY